MKLIYVLFLLIIISGCHRDSDNIFRWRPADSECDEMVYRIDSAWASGEPSFIIERRLDILDSLSSRRGVSPQSRGRYHYWRARVARVTNEMEIHKEDSLARCYMDSLEYPYDHARLNAVRHSVYSSDFIKRYALLLSSMKYAESTGDDYLLAEAMMTLSEYGWNYANDSQSASLLARAEALFRTLGLAHRGDVASLNLSLVEGDSVKVVDGLRRLVTRRRSHGGMDEAASINEILLSIMSDDMEGLEKAYSDSVMSPGMKSWILGSISNVYRKRGLQDKVDSLALASVAVLDEAIADGRTTGDMQFFSAVYPMLIDCVSVYERRGMYDSCYYYLQKATAVDSDYDGSHGIVQSRYITKAWMEEAIKKQEELNRRNHTVTILWWALSLVVFAAVLFAVWFLMSRRMRRERLKKEAAELEKAKLELGMEEKDRKIVSSALAMTEKDNILQYVLDDIARLESLGTLSSTDARSLDSNIRTHLSSKIEWDQFRIMFDKVHPSFIKHLRQRYPAMTEGDMRMAVYVKIGLGNKQISRMLMLTPGSVKMKRHRLREHMGLGPDDSLEDVLSSID